MFASADLDKTLWELYLPHREDEELAEVPINDATLAVRDAGDGGKGRFTPIGPVVAPGHEPGPEGFALRSASADLSHIVFSVNNELKQLWPGDETLPGATSLYEYRGVGGGEPVLVGVENEGALKGSPHVNEGADLISQCGTLLGSAGINPLSTSGDVAYFTALACGEAPHVNELYARVDGARTVAVSEPAVTGTRASECTGVCLEDENAEGGAKRGAAAFAGASQDGSKVFFSTEQPLLNVDHDTGNDLYEAELEGGEDPRIERLTMVSQGGEGDATPGEGSGFTGVLATSEDGSRVYFEATGELTTKANGNGERAEAGANNLYVYDTVSGQLSFVAIEPIPPFDLTHDGQFAVFESTRKVVGTDDSSEARQLFEYDAASGTLARVSIGQRVPGGAECEATHAIESAYNCDGNTDDEAQAPTLDESGTGSSPAESTSKQSVAEDGRSSSRAAIA